MAEWFKAAVLKDFEGPPVNHSNSCLFNNLAFLFTCLELSAIAWFSDTGNVHVLRDKVTVETGNCIEISSGPRLLTGTFTCIIGMAGLFSISVHIHSEGLPRQLVEIVAPLQIQIVGATLMGWYVGKRLKIIESRCFAQGFLLLLSSN